MQTFLPYPSFTESARVLDNKRLGKQRVECLQILKALTEPNYGWQSHPIIKMWRGYEPLLVIYGLTICTEWNMRGYKDNTGFKLVQIICNRSFDAKIYFHLEMLKDWLAIENKNGKHPVSYPSWLGNDVFHLSHQSNLLRKDFNHYSQYFKVPDNLPYQWYNPDTKMFYTTK